MRITFLGLVCSVLMVPAAFAGTLDTVKSQGFFNCGVSQGVPGFSNPDENGNWSGIDVDVCRAVSAAIFGDPDKVKYVPLTAKERFTALQSGEIDVLSRNTTWTLSRDAQIGLEFAGVNFYDEESSSSSSEASGSEEEEQARMTVADCLQRIEAALGWGGPVQPSDDDTIGSWCRRFLHYSWHCGPARQMVISPVRAPVHENPKPSADANRLWLRGHRCQSTTCCAEACGT